MHLPTLVYDLALILITAGVASLLFQRFKQPVVLGYILAGLLVGPYFPYFPGVEDTENVEIWGEIGIAFLLFALGLEFSFRKLLRVGMPASVTAVTEILLMVFVGYWAGRFLGWNHTNSLFLGGILSISSTTIILKVFEEMQVKGRKFADLVFGTLVVEDLIAILLLVLLSTIAVSQDFEGLGLLWSVLRLLFFLVLWFSVGIFLIPKIFRKLAPWLGKETLLVVVLGMCFAMVVLATSTGFSPALGAFVMGSILAETDFLERIEEVVKPVRDLFAAVFFVSVGMLIDPKILFDYAGPIVFLTLLTIVGKVFGTGFGALLAGQSLRTSVFAGLSMAQIGEFSFIIAALGVSLKVTGDFLYPIAVGIAAVTTFTTPYLLRSSEYLFSIIDSRMPSAWKRWILSYQVALQRFRLFPNWKIFFKTVVKRESSSLPLAPWDAHVTELMISPGSTLVGKTLEQSKVRETFGVSIALIERGDYLRMAPGRNNILYPSDKIHVIGTEDQIERFRAVTESKRNETRLDNLNEHFGLDALLISKNSPFMNRTIRDSGIREKSGGLIVGIERGKERILNPDSTTKIEMGDLLWIVGDKDRISLLKQEASANG